VKNAADSILEQVAGTVNLATSIEVLTQQQQTASHQIVGKMQQINTVTSQTVNSVKQSEVVTYQVKESAHALELSANSFQLGVTS
jgi:methyl-accepting chemotaxis protein